MSQIEARGELKERSASLNTFLRFGRERPALHRAYALRTYLQLRGARLEEEQQELARVERVIATLEKRKTSGIQKLINSIIEMVKEALNPDQEADTTLLDQFRDRQPALLLEEDEGGAEVEETLEQAQPLETPETTNSEPRGPEPEESDWGWSTNTPIPSARTPSTPHPEEEADYGWGPAASPSSTPSSWTDAPTWTSNEPWSP